MEILGYIYGVILLVLKKKISADKALEIIREKLSEQDKESVQKQ